MRKNRPHKSGGSFPEIGSSKAVLSSETGRNAPDIHQGVGLSCGEVELVKASSSFEKSTQWGEGQFYQQRQVRWLQAIDLNRALHHQQGLMRNGDSPVKWGEP